MVKSEIKKRRMSAEPVRLETFPSGEFFRKERDGDIYKKLMNLPDSVVTLNMRNLEVIIGEYHSMVIPTIVVGVEVVIEEVTIL